MTTIEGLAQGGNLHPMQAAFLEHDGFQCDYCTPGQICSAVALLEEARAGAPSVVTPDISELKRIELTDDEIRERIEWQYLPLRCVSEHRSGALWNGRTHETFYLYARCRCGRSHRSLRERARWMIYRRRN